MGAEQLNDRFEIQEFESALRGTSYILRDKVTGVTRTYNESWILMIVNWWNKRKAAAKMSKWQKVSVYLLRSGGFAHTVEVENWGVDKGVKWMEVKLGNGTMIEFCADGSVEDAEWCMTKADDAAVAKFKATAEKLLPHVVALAAEIDWSEVT